MPRVHVEGLARQRRADLRRDVVPDADRVAGERAELAEDRRLLYEGRAERDERTVAEHRLAVLLPLIIGGELLQAGIVVFLVDLHDAAGDLDAPVAVERIDAKRAAAADGTRRNRQIAVDERRVRRIVEDAAELTVEELRLRVALQRVLEPPRQVHIRQRHRPVLRDRGDEQVDLLVAEDVAEAHLRAAEDVAVAGHADVHRRPALEEHLLERALLAHVLLHERVLQRRLEIDDRSRRAKVGARGGVKRLFPL